MDINTLRAAAKAKRKKVRAKRWTEIEKRATLSNFLNSNSEQEIVEVTGKTAAQITTALNTFIKTDELDELVMAVDIDNVAYLVNMVEDDVEVEVEAN